MILVDKNLIFITYVSDYAIGDEICCFDDAATVVSFKAFIAIV